MNTCGLFVCPVCKSGLAKNGGSYRCEQGHCFDISAQGHVNLLLANRMNSHAPGDDKDMVAARARFLAKRYYAPLQEAIGALVADFAPQNAAVLDLGCGEGYYTSGVCEALASAGKRGRVAGVDISKSAAKLAAKLAAKQCPSAEIAVASVFHLPVANASCDIVLNCFSPLCLAEILRVLRTGGYFIYVVPAARHLWGLKSAVYEHPYENETQETPYDGFTYVRIETVRKTIRLACQSDIQDLFGMTPYAWKTARQDKAKLAALDTLDTEIAFDIHVYQKQ